jgi:flagellar hook-basal body complex protein FliE
MAIDPLSASKAYLEAARAAQGLASSSGQARDGASLEDSEFSHLIGNVLREAQSTGRNAEAQGLAALSGRADVVDEVVEELKQKEKIHERKKR